MTITSDVDLPGRLSRVDRQIDILVEGSFAGIARAIMAVDCKCWSSKVDVKDMEAFIGLLDDVGVHLGMLVTTKGFTPAAERRATHVLQEVVPLVEIAVFDRASSWWLMRAGQSGTYVGDYLDHEPYGQFWWRVLFVTGGPDDDDEDVLWASSEGGWDIENGSRLLATLLARHRLARQPDADEVASLARAIDRNVEEGKGFFIPTSAVDDWMAGSEEPDDEREAIG